MGENLRAPDRKLYGYVQGNPISNIDPTGLDTYRVNRDLRVMGNSAESIYNPLTHTFLGRPILMALLITHTAEIYGARLEYFPEYIEPGPFSAVQVYYFQTTPAEEAEIAARIEKGSDPGPGFCASAVSNTLNGIGPFKNLGHYWTPAGLGNALGNLGNGSH